MTDGSSPCPSCGASIALGEWHACPKEPIGACEDIAACTPGEAIDPPESECFGQFVRVSLIGRGGMGEVWKAWDTLLGRWVALKFLHEVDARDLALFQVEAHVASNMAHPNIAAIYDAGEGHDLYFIAMQLVEGRTLESMGRQEPRRAAGFVLDAARAVAHAHAQGVVHRDLKPANLMVTPAGHLYVMDFGLATRADLKASLNHEVVGTPSYMSPEQMKGELPHVRDDIFALGVTLKELLPLKAPAELRRIVSKATAMDPARRYQAAGELVDDLSRWLNRRRKWWLWTAAACLVVAASGIFTASLVEGTKRQRVEEAESWSWKAENLINTEDFKGAVEACTRVIELRPTAKAYLTRSFANAELGNLQASLDDCQRAVDLEPTNQAAIRTLARAKAEIAGGRGD